MTIYYVSDLLSDLLGAEETRRLVREQCEIILQDVPPETAGKLRAPLDYISGKCMGFPAAWLVTTALGLGPGEMAERLRRQPGPLFVSLTTSIADDFIDSDPNIGSAHMMLLYLFMFSSLRHPHWFEGELLQSYQRHIYPLVGAFVGDAPFGQAVPAEKLERQAEASGQRIGNFFETIVRALTLDDPLPVRDQLSAIGRAFGNWCSYLDDVVDVERDIESGDTVTYPLFLLTGRSPALARAVANRDVDACRPELASEWFVAALASRHARHLNDICATARRSDFDRLADRLEVVIPHVCADVLSIRRENAATVATCGFPAVGKASQSL